MSVNTASQRLAEVLRAGAAATGVRSPLTGPLVLSAMTDPSEPAHWAPNIVSEPIYAQLYAERLAQLAAGLDITGELPAITAAEDVAS